MAITAPKKVTSITSEDSYSYYTVVLPLIFSLTAWKCIEIVGTSIIYVLMRVCVTLAVYDPDDLDYKSSWP